MTVNTLNYNLDRLASKGLPIYISEFEVEKANDGEQLKEYKNYFSLFWKHPGVKEMAI